jgi:elongation factor G
MDKPSADFDECIKSIEKKLNTTALELQMPIRTKEEGFIGVIDLINMKKITWNNRKSSDSYGKLFQLEQLDVTDEQFTKAFKKRVSLIERLAHLNEQFAEMLLEKYNLNCANLTDNILLESYLRQTCIKKLATPVLCGSSFKNMCVQLLMDAMIKYLPSPNELNKNDFRNFYDDNFSAICFKIIHDHQKSRKKVNTQTSTASLQQAPLSKSSKEMNDENENILSFLRIYSGELSAKTKIYNASKHSKEICDKIYIPYANQIKQVNKQTCGNIAVVSGLVNVKISN